jgi:hypothetical protein
MAALRLSLASKPAAAGRSWVGAGMFATVTIDQPRGT